MKSYFLELWGFGNLSFLFFVHDFLSSRVKLVHLAKNNCFIVGAEVCCVFFFFFPPFGGSPRHVAFPSVLASVSQAHLVCTDQSENPTPHPFQNNLCAAMLNIQAIYAGRGYRDHQRQALSAQWKNTPHSQAILHYSLWLIMLPCVCFIYSASAHIGMVNDSLPRQVYLEIALQQYF